MPSPASPAKLDVIPFVARPVGWMVCVACSDYKKKPGTMWLGYNFKTYEDYTIPCPVCKGVGKVKKYKYYDVRTGREIDYENPHLTFVYVETLDK